MWPKLKKKGQIEIVPDRSMCDAMELPGQHCDQEVPKEDVENLIVQFQLSQYWNIDQGLL